MSKTEKELKQEFEEDIYKVEPEESFADRLVKVQEMVDSGVFGRMGKHHGEIVDRLVVDAIRNTEHRGDGLSTHYYELPKGATELRHIIKHKKMEHGIGEAFCALYRLNDNGEYLRNLKKALFYIQAAIEYEEAK